MFRASDIKFSDDEKIRIILLTSLFVFLVHGGTSWLSEVPLTIFCGFGIILPLGYRDTRLWMFVATTLLTTTYLGWYLLDNHVYLMTYWACACFVYVCSNDIQSLVQNARFLVFLTFALATFNKILFGEYLAGDFIHSTLLFDDRVRWLGYTIGGLERHMVEQNQVYYDLLLRYPESIDHMPVSTTTILYRFSVAISYLTILVEGLIALLFFLPLSKRLEWTRFSCLLVFIICVYFFLPVTGFASILSVLGMACAVESEQRWQLGFLCVLLISHISYIPWTDWI